MKLNKLALFVSIVSLLLSLVLFLVSMPAHADTNQWEGSLTYKQMVNMTEEQAVSNLCGFVNHNVIGCNAITAIMGIYIHKMRMETLDAYIKVLQHTIVPECPDKPK